MHNGGVSIIRDLDVSLRPEALLWFRLLLQRAHLGDAGHPDPSLVSEFVFPLQWFLDEVGGAGIRLTDAGYLPPPIVSKAMTVSSPGFNRGS